MNSSSDERRGTTPAFDYKARSHLRRLLLGASNLPDAELRVAIAFLEYLNPYTGTVWAPREALALECCVSPATAKRCMQTLAGWGVIRPTGERRGLTGRVPEFEVVMPDAEVIHRMGSRVTSLDSSKWGQRRTVMGSTTHGNGVTGDPRVGFKVYELELPTRTRVRDARTRAHARSDPAMQPAPAAQQQGRFQTKAKANHRPVPFIDGWLYDEQKTREMAELTDTPNVGTESWPEWRHRICQSLHAMKARSDPEGEG